MPETQPAGTPGSVIRRIDVYRVGIPFSSTRHTSTATDAAFHASSAEYSALETLMVKVTTRDGRSGWGESFGHAGNPATSAALAGAVGKFFIGKDAEAPAVLNDQVRRASHSFGQGGPFIHAMSGIDTALWDLAAQRAGVPLYRLLGGTGDGVVEAYASLVSYENNPTEVAAETARAHGEGFAAIKLHETTYDAVKAAKGALPATAPLMVDVNCVWREDEATAELKRWRELDLAFVEEPVWPVDDHAALARVRAATGVRLAGGENGAGLMGFRAMMDAGAFDVVQPSVAKVGGISVVREIIALAAARGVTVLPHCFYCGPGYLATAHIVASLNNGARLETPYLKFQALLYEAMALAPTLALSQAPGLGFVPDAAVLEKFLIHHFAVE
jgi:L-alanine-DL-glutamate epimerase-like enolase superfamily enzyme